jgi:glycosyltransferase involved in cell wall biosynthesis
VVLSGYGVVHRGAETMLGQVLPRLEHRFDFHLFSRSGLGPGGVRRPAIPRTVVEPLYRVHPWVRRGLDTLFLDPLHVEWTTHLLASLPALLRGRYQVIWHETGLWGGTILRVLRRRSGYRLLDFARSNALGWEVPFARCRLDLYVTYTEAFASEIRRQVPGLRVEVVPQGVDLELFRPGVPAWPLQLPRPVVVAAGALSREKAPELVVEAAALAECSLALVGDGPLAERLDRLAAEVLPEGRYRRLAVPRESMPSIYAAADAVVLASPVEGGPNAVLEALACGRPVVTAADPGRVEILGEDGVLVREQTAEAYAAGIRAALAGEWGERSRRRAGYYSVEVTADRLGGLLDELAAEGR